MNPRTRKAIQGKELLNKYLDVMRTARRYVAVRDRQPLALANQSAAERAHELDHYLALQKACRQLPDERFHR